MGIWRDLSCAALSADRQLFKDRLIFGVAREFLMDDPMAGAFDTLDVQVNEPAHGPVSQAGAQTVTQGPALEVERGFIYATTGENYTILARRAARNLRAVMPDAVIDLYTDQQISDPVFDCIHQTSDSFFRPKIEAMQRSRFARTVYLDADTIVVADISDLFPLLDRFDLAATHALHRGRPMGDRELTVPAAFPQFNSGLVVLRRSEATQMFLSRWGVEMRATGAGADQPSMRRLLFNGNLRIATLPPEYNLFRMSHLDFLDESIGAPRMLHVQALHRGPPGDPEKPFDVVETIGEERARHLSALIAAEPALGGDGSGIVESLLLQRWRARAKYAPKPTFSRRLVSALRRRLGSKMLR